jgi:hypothetical protein
MSRQSFVDACVAGVVSADTIDDYVDRWHAGEGDGSLAEFLGFTEEEYASWVESPDEIDAILRKRKDAALRVRATK